MNNAPNHRLLMIDDNRAIHDDFRKVLCAAAATDDLDDLEARLLGESAPAEERPEFEIDSAFQGQEGVEMLRAAHDAGRPYAAAFVDVRMPPGIDGIETVVRLWAAEPDLQVVICTAYADYSWKEMIGRLGYSDRLLILKKPFDSTEVLQLACALTEKWRLVQEARWQLDKVTRLVEERTSELRKTNEQLCAEIRHREQVEAQLLRTQRLESIGTLTSGIAHNLNNMLTPILMGIPALMNNLPPPARKTIIGTIETSAQRAADIVRQLVTFARGTEGERSPLDASYLVREVAKIAEETFPKNIVVDAPPAGDLSMILADATQVHQLLMNLCINARDAMPEGGVLGIEAANFEVDENYAHLTPEAHVGHYIVLRVSDTGTGIPPEVLARIFDPFFSTKPVEKGSGLGLSTVAGIVRGHDGFINVISEVGTGSTFEVFLPASETTAAALAAKPSPPKNTRGNGELVLIVDDEVGIREVTTALLNESGYRTLAAADGAEALRLYAERGAEIVVVLTDVLMPVLDGAALCRELRRLDPRVRIVASTGEAEASKFAQLRELGVTHFLSKPYRIDYLLATLREALDGSVADS